MATTTLRFTGTSKWNKLREVDEKYQNWTIQVFLDEPSRNLLKSSGLSIRPKTDENTNTEYVTFRRPLQKAFKTEVVTFDAPKVTNPDGTEFKDIIGHGSTVACRVIAYDTKFGGKGHRLEEVTVLNHVPYVKNTTPSHIPTTPAQGARPF